MAELSTLARPYAKAAFEYASEAGWLASWETMLGVAAAVARNEKVARMLSSPAYTSSRQARQFIELCGEGITPQVGNFIHLLAEHKRLPLLPFISEQFNALKAELDKTIDVTIATAFPMNPLEIEILARSLGEKLARRVQVISESDESLIGGVVIRAGDTVIDGSVRGRLARLKEAVSH